MQLSASARTFHHHRALAFELEKSGAALLNGDREALRVSVTVANGPEVERVVQIPVLLLPQVRQVQSELRRVLEFAALPAGNDLRVALLGQLVRELLGEESGQGGFAEPRHRESAKGACP
jgi:hypothetical protein